jgi:hypothetical protein
MGLFNFFKQNQPQNTSLASEAIATHETSDVPRELFVEDSDPQEQQTMYSSNGVANGIEVVYAFLQADFEAKGYHDVLTNADDSNKSNGIKLIKLDLQILIKRVNNYYEKKIKDYDLHISSRGRAGLIDLVEELKSEKDKAEKDIEEVNIIASEIESGTGMVERIILSYQKGFMRGLSAITQSKVLK